MLQAEGMAERVRCWLNERSVGTVHSLFRRVCNLAWGDWVISLHTAAIGRLPGGVAVAGDVDFTRLGLRQGQTVWWRSDLESLCMGRSTLPLGNTPLSPAAAAPLAALPAPESLEARRELLLRWMRSHGRGLLGAQASKALIHEGGTLQRLAARTAWMRGQSLCDSLLDGEAQAIGPGVAALLGLGEGLTPAGDDLVLGMMAAFAHCRPALEPSLAARIDRLNQSVDATAAQATTRISANYLRLGALGEFSERLSSAAAALLDESARSDAVGTAIVRLLESGHSSGTDSATGLYLGMTVIMAQHRQASNRGAQA